MHRPGSNPGALATWGLPPLGSCWPAARAPARPFGVTQRGPLDLGVQELKSLGGMLYSVQPLLPEAGGRVGEVSVAVSWVWQPGASCGGGFLGSGVGLLPPFPAPAGAMGADACEFMRLGWAPPFGVCIRRPALDSSPCSSGQKILRRSG